MADSPNLVVTVYSYIIAYIILKIEQMLIEKSKIFA